MTFKSLEMPMKNWQSAFMCDATVLMLKIWAAMDICVQALQWGSMQEY
jgi:hypothetical protein